MEKRNINFTGEALLPDRDERTQDRKIKTLNKVRHSIYRGSAMSLFLILSCSIFVVEVPVMLLIGAIQPSSQLGAALLDSTLILVGIFPILFFFIFRPLTVHIAERKQAGDALRESEKLYHSLFMNMLNGFAYCQMHFDDNDKPYDFTYLSVNSAFETLTRLENVVGKKVTEVIPGIRESDPELLEIYGRVSKTGKSERFEMFVDSLQRWFFISVYSPKQGYFVTVFDVITERKQAEETLKNTLFSTEAILESIHNGILVVSHRGAVIKYNAKFVEMWRIPGDILASGDDKTIQNSVLGQLSDPDKFIAKISELYEKPEAESLDSIYLKDGRIFKRISKPMYLGGESKGRVWSFLDITERKQAEAEIKLKNEELQKVNAEKDKFFSIIAHDLRSPFNGFLGLTQIMAEELPSLTMDEIQEITVSLRNSANNLYRLLENLLEWASMQQGLNHFDPEVLELLPIVNESIKIVLESAKIKGIEIACDIPFDINIFADKNIVQSVIRNLVSNAVKFTTKGGKVSVSAQATDDKSVAISIRDTGIGMSPEMVKNLFRLDVQTNRKGTEGEPSSGLGLLLCKEFIEKYGGKIWVESEVGKGSEFKFTLPMESN